MSPQTTRQHAVRFGLLVGTLLTSLAFPLWAGTQEDPLVGTWVTDVIESKTEPGPFPFKNWTSVIQRVDEGYRVIGHGTNIKGEVVHSEILWRFDGKEALAVESGASPNQSAVTYSWKRLDHHSFETVQKRPNGTLTSRTVISPDGKLRINFHTFRNSQNEITRNSFEVMYKK